MSIHKAENGTYLVRYRVLDQTTGRFINKAKRGFKLRREAVEFEKNVDTSPMTSLDHSMTFRQLWDEWEVYMRSSDLTKEKHKEHFEIRFSEYLDKPVDKFTRPMLNKWITSLAHTKYSTKTKNMTISFVKSVFKYAYDMYGITNPTVLIKPFKRTDSEVMQEMEVWTPEEFSQFISCVHNDLYKLFFETLFWTGMRRGEAIALSVSDLSNGRLNIHSSQRIAKNGRKPTKTRTQRKIQINTKLNNELQSLAKGRNKSEYLFGGTEGLAPTTINRYFNEAIKESGVKPIRIHDLRHSHATWLINNGANIVSVSKRLGHATIEQTLKTYTHLLQSTEDDLLELIEKNY